MSELENVMPEENIASSAPEAEKLEPYERKIERLKQKKDYPVFPVKQNDLALRTIKTIQNVAHLAGFSIKGPVTLIDDKTGINWR